MSKVTWLVLGVCVTVSGWLGFWTYSEAIAQELEAVEQQERQELLDKAVTPFLQALQTGDTQMLEGLIGGKLALTLGRLLRENTEYPKFLRQRYGGTTVQEPIQIVQRSAISSGVEATDRGQRMALVQMQTASGDQDNFQLTLDQDNQGAWKIVDKTMQR